MNDRPKKLEPARAEGAFLVVECDVPAEMTLCEWRRKCADDRRAEQAAAKRGRLRRVLRRAA